MSSSALRSVKAAPDAVSIPFMISQLVGAEVSAMALICTVGRKENASVAAFITPSGPALSMRFRHAIEMEGAYNDTLLNFDHTTPPFYGSPININMRKAARTLGVERVLCLVTVNLNGLVSAVRDYDGVEVTLLEAAQTQFERFKEILNGVSEAEKIRSIQ